MKKYILEVIKGFCLIFTVLSLFYFSNANSDISTWKVSILFPSLFLVISLSVIHFITMLSLGVKKDFSVVQSEIIDGEVDLDELLQKIELYTQWHLKSKSNEKLIIHTPMSFKSFGETIQISKVGNIAFLTSKPAMFTTLFDFGKSYQNIQLLKSMISHGNGVPAATEV